LLLVKYLIENKKNSFIIYFSFLEGFKEAAQKFGEEAGISLNNIDLSSLDERLQIREAIENGRIEQAIHFINTKTPQLLDQNRQLAFHLKVTFRRTISPIYHT
jgi:hypothetical protein